MLLLLSLIIVSSPLRLRWLLPAEPAKISFLEEDSLLKPCRKLGTLACSSSGELEEGFYSSIKPEGRSDLNLEWLDYMIIV